MSDRHMHITQFIFGDPGIERFVAALEERFQWVTPIRRPADGAVVAVAFMVKDLGDLGAELYDMPEAEEALAGLLEQDVEIVSAWEDPRPSREPQRVWNVKGRRTLANEKTTVVARDDHQDWRETLTAASLTAARAKFGPGFASDSG